MINGDMDLPIYSAQVISKKLLTSDIIELRLSKPANFHYQAGQFVQWLVPDGAAVIRRPYSLSSAPHDQEIEFCVKILPGGVASALAEQLQPNETLQIQGPRGKFVHAGENTPLYFIATGAGVAPIMGLIRDELEYKKTDDEIRLLWGNRSEGDVFWNDRLESLKQAYDNFSYHLTLSQPKAGGGWSGLRGRVTDHILHHLVNHEFFLCGNAAMVKDVRQLLLENGVMGEKIHFEIF